MERFAHLHLHSEYSLLDGACRVADIPRRAREMGQDAVAITDHGVVQAFPDIMNAADDLARSGKNIKILYGMEAYYVNDTARVIYGQDRPDFDGSMVVFDIETTGLSPVDCGITEIGASLYRGGEIVENFGTYVNPEMPIPENITRLTGITDEMVKDAPLIDEVMPEFLDFCKNFSGPHSCHHLISVVFYPTLSPKSIFSPQL